jgi:hypothetical protein
MHLGFDIGINRIRANQALARLSRGVVEPTAFESCDGIVFLMLQQIDNARVK